MYKKVYQVGH